MAAIDEPVTTYAFIPGVIGIGDARLIDFDCVLLDLVVDSHFASTVRSSCTSILSLAFSASSPRDGWRSSAALNVVVREGAPMAVAVVEKERVEAGTVVAGEAVTVVEARIGLCRSS
jgi:hypothetical protein